MLYAFALMIGISQAGTLGESLMATRQALLEEDTERALSLLVQARASASNETVILDAATIAQLVYLEGLVPRLMDIERDRDIEKLREALVIFPTFRWDRELLDDKEMRGFFEALRSEVVQRDAVPTQVPAVRGLLKAYVDGVEHRENQAVRMGDHVAQVECPDGKIAGQWTRFEPGFDWIGMCPGGVDLEQPTPVEEMDEFALDDPNPRAGPEPLAWTPPAAKERRNIDLSFLRSNPMLTGAVASLAVSSITYIAALNARKKYDDLSGAGMNTPSELSKQRRRTNGLVYASSVFAATGTGLAVAVALDVEF